METTFTSHPRNPAVNVDNGMVEGHGNTLISRFLNDEAAIERYPNLKPQHFPSPVQAEIVEVIQTLHYDGHPTNFVAVEDYLRSRGRLAAIGEHTLSDLAGDSRITAMDDGC